jgi:glucose-6-phosphate isomerase
VLDLQRKVAGALSATAKTADQIADTVGEADQAETVFALLEHLAANGRAKAGGGDRPGTRTFASAG